ncbi:MAG: Adaptive response protein AidB N-terminal domain, partial [Thermoleophilales bacterium]|nr:Adaptive response protein AidB N-terminal domain [Thermoleophilales bacterium]
MSATLPASVDFNLPPPLEGHNAFESNVPLVEAVDREGAGWAVDRLRKLGDEAG